MALLQYPVSVLGLSIGTGRIQDWAPAVVPKVTMITTLVAATSHLVLLALDIDIIKDMII